MPNKAPSIKYQKGTKFQLIFSQIRFHLKKVKNLKKKNSSLVFFCKNLNGINDNTEDFFEEWKTP
jgi:hypothetical protein